MKILLASPAPATEERPTLPPSQLDDDLDDELHSYIVQRKNARDRVLVVDDDHAIVSSLQGILEDEGYEVEVAHGGKEAILKILALQEPDVILLDWMMPGIGGDVVHELVKRSPALAHIPILIITAQAQAFRDIGALNDPDRIELSNPTRATKLAARKAAKAGTIVPPTEVVPKPFDLDGLLVKVRTAIAAKKQRGGPAS